MTLNINQRLVRYMAMGILKATASDDSLLLGIVKMLMSFHARCYKPYKHNKRYTTGLKRKILGLKYGMNHLPNFVGPE